MNRTEGARLDAAALDPPRLSLSPLKPALASIKDSLGYMGGVSRAKFYADILPELETIKLGKRNLVVVASMDRLIEARKAPQPTTAPEAAHAASSG